MLQTNSELYKTKLLFQLTIISTVISVNDYFKTTHEQVHKIYIGN